MRELNQTELDQVSGGAGGFKGLLTALSAIPINGKDTIFDIAHSMPEFPGAKPGSWQAKFDVWEDALEFSIGFRGAGFE